MSIENRMKRFDQAQRRRVNWETLYKDALKFTAQHREGFDEKMKGATDETPFVQHGSKDIRDLHDAKVAASRFADYVS